MSEIRLNIVDSERTISGQVHGCIGDAVVAALSAEPETIHELELALERFVRPEREHSPSCSHHESHSGDADVKHQAAHADKVALPHHASHADEHAAYRSPFAFFRQGLDLEPYDAGIMVVDLAGRVVAVDSTYSLPQAAGEVCCLGYEMLDQFTGDPFEDDDETFEGSEDMPGVEYISTDLAEAADSDAPARLILPYRLPDDWLFVYSIPEYEGVCRERRARRSDVEPIDAREVLYGHALLEFIAREMAAAAKSLEGTGPALTERPIESDAQTPESDEQAGDNWAAANPEAYDLLVQAHVKWLMTERNDLWGRTPREVLLHKKDSIGFDLHTRQLQWSFTGEPPAPIPSSSHAYRFAGFATEEIVIYYYLVRFLMRESYKRACQDREISVGDEIERLEKLKTGWLESPHRDYMNRSPLQIIESERRRLPIAGSGREAMVDEENCALCAAMAKELKTPYFWHLDGCNMDDRFEFSFHKTREEWEAEQRSYEEFNREFAREQAEQKAAGIDDKPTIDGDDEDEDLTIH